MLETYLGTSKYIWVTIWDTRMTYFKNIISIFYIYFGFTLILVVLLQHKSTLIEYSTVVEYSVISNFDFLFSKNFAYSILSIQNDLRSILRNKLIHINFWNWRISTTQPLKNSIFTHFLDPPTQKTPLCRHIEEVCQHSVNGKMFS